MSTFECIDCSFFIKVLAVPTRVSNHLFIFFSIIIFLTTVALRNGYVDAKQQRDFFVTLGNIRMRDTTSTSAAAAAASAEESSGSASRRAYDAPFGKPTIHDAAGLGELIAGKFTNYGGDDVDYPDLSHISCRSGLPLPRDTRATHMQRELVRSRMESDSAKVSGLGGKEHHFTMKRFQNVPGRLDIPK